MAKSLEVGAPLFIIRWWVTPPVYIIFIILLDITQNPKTLNTILSNSPTPKSNKTLLGCIQYYYYGVGWDVFWGTQEWGETKNVENENGYRRANSKTQN